MIATVPADLTFRRGYLTDITLQLTGRSPARTQPRAAALMVLLDTPVSLQEGQR